MNTMLMLVRREFWEHRSLWLAPLVWAGLIVVMSMWGTIMTLQHGDALTIGHYATIEEIPNLNAEERAELSDAVMLTDDRKATVYAIAQLALCGMISAVVLIVVFFYLIDSLYAERRDRSILFWKSLPVSDTQVVLSKLAVALVIMPLAVLAFAAVTQLVVSLIFWIRFHGTVLGEIMPAFSLKGWIVSMWTSLVFSLGGVLWYVPIAGYLLLVSVWARRTVFLWAILPPAALMLLEKMFIGTEHVAEFLGRRFAGFVEEMEVHSEQFKQAGDAHVPTLGEAFDAIHVSGLFMHYELWLGLLAGAALIYATIRIRRYRDEG
jgi:ABC-2 type transport system permease protein